MVGPVARVRQLRRPIISVRGRTRDKQREARRKSRGAKDRVNNDVNTNATRMTLVRFGALCGD